MAFKLVRYISKKALADNNAAEIELGALSPHGALRISEYGGQDGIIKVTQGGTAVAQDSNGIYVRANSTIFVTPEERPSNLGGSQVALDGTDSDSSNAGDAITLESGLDSTGNSVLLFDGGEVEFRLSVINETNGSNTAIYIEEVAMTNTIG